MNILIAGAGIGGLTAALCLQKTGHQVQLLEQAPKFIEVGAGIQCGANALRVLDYLGLKAEIEYLMQVGAVHMQVRGAVALSIVLTKR